MKRTLLFTLLALAGIAVFAEKTEDLYVSRQTEKGLLFFIKPYEIPALTKGMKPALTDITLLTTQDSVTVNMSVFYPSVLSLDSIVFVAGERLSFSHFETFFIDAEKKSFHHRYSCRMTYNQLKTLYLNVPFTLMLYSGDIPLRYAFASKEWTKHRQSMTQILRLIDNNRRVQSFFPAK